ncbi:MAG: hypothetical protein FWG13_07740 [Leptospirales bacterium]|nr:hypothetical protein [Leptospirales bacterium]
MHFLPFSGTQTRIAKSNIIAHRGCWNTGAGENTVAALLLADRLGVYGSEFDVRLTADNVPVVNHDKDARGFDIHTLNYAELKSAVPELPTLADFLENGKNLTIKMVLELKPHGTAARDREAASVVVNMVRKFGMAERVEYITFSLEAGKEIIRLAPTERVSYLSGNLPPAELKKIGFTGMDYPLDVMLERKEYFSEAKAGGLSVNIWTVNNPVIAKKLISEGADFITTDEPELCLR